MYIVSVSSRLFSVAYPQTILLEAELLEAGRRPALRPLSPKSTSSGMLSVAGRGSDPLFAAVSPRRMRPPRCLLAVMAGCGGRRGALTWRCLDLLSVVCCCCRCCPPTAGGQ